MWGCGKVCVCVSMCVSVRVCVGKKNVISFGRSRSQPSAKLPTHTYPLAKPTRQANAFSWEKSCNLASFFTGVFLAAISNMIFPLTNYVIQNKACCLNFNWKICNFFCSASCCWPEAVKRTLAWAWAWAYYGVWSLIINQLPERTSKPRTGSGAHRADESSSSAYLPEKGKIAAATLAAGDGPRIVWVSRSYVAHASFIYRPSLAAKNCLFIADCRPNERPLT